MPLETPIHSFKVRINLILTCNGGAHWNFPLLRLIGKPELQVRYLFGGVPIFLGERVLHTTRLLALLEMPLTLRSHLSNFSQM